MILYCFRFQSGIFIIVDFVQNQVTELFFSNLRMLPRKCQMQLKVMQSLRSIRWVLHLKTDKNLKTLKERNSVPYTEGQQSLSQQSFIN